MEDVGVVEEWESGARDVTGIEKPRARRRVSIDLALTLAAYLDTLGFEFIILFSSFISNRFCHR